MRAGLGVLVAATMLVTACGSTAGTMSPVATAGEATLQPTPFATPLGTSAAVPATASPVLASPPDASPAPYPAPLRPRATFTYYFYWYDDETGLHLGPHGPATIWEDPLTERPVPEPSTTWRGTAWHAKQLTDMAYAGIDVALPVFWGDTEQELWPRPGVANLARALERVRVAGTTPPAVGMFYDTISRQGLDVRTKAGRDAIYDDVRYFFTTIPRPYWALARGSRPIIWFYYALALGGYDSGFLADLRARFARDFGTQPYIVVERDWLDLQPDLTGYDDTYRFNGPTPQSWTATVASVSPGFDNRWIVGPDHTVVPREGGAFYARGLSEAIECGTPWLAVETWSEFHEATEVAETVEYGRQYLDITRRYVAWFKAGALPAGMRIESPYADSPSVSAKLGAADGTRGLTLAPSREDGLHVAVVEAGRAGRRTVFRSADATSADATAAYLYFRVDDGFYFNRPHGVRIDVTYFDQGTAPIYLDYDAAPCASAWSAETMYKPVLLARPADTKKWKTASIVLRDATFTGHQNLASDFRLVAQFGHPLSVGEVDVTKLP